MIRLAFVHHTENPNGCTASEVPAMLLAIYQFHRFVRGWNDIGYNFVIDAFGRIWEAREGGVDQAVIGAQAGGYNAVSTGVAVLGCFIDVVPSQAAIDALQSLLAWKLALHGVAALGRVTVEVDPASAFFTPFAPGAHVSLPRVAGHRDGDSTACPGDAFYARLPGIRPNIAQLAGSPATLTLSPSRTAATAPAAIELSGHAPTLDGGAAVSGAQIELQQLTASGTKTIATVASAGDGSWRAQLTLTHNLLVRALRLVGPATASDLVAIAVAPAIELNAVPHSPPRVSGTVSPPKRHVTVDVYGLERRHRRLIMSKRVPVRHGRFLTRIGILRRGSYVVRARTVADSSNAAAVSRSVSVHV